MRADIITSFCQNLDCEISPVCAFLGGQLAQDVINVLGGREQPLQNFVVFDGEDVRGLVYSLYTDMVGGMRDVFEEEAAVAAAAAKANGGVVGNGTGGGQQGRRSQRGMVVPV